MTAPPAFLPRIADALEESGVPYMLTGSVGAAQFGETRATHDIDVVIDPTPDQLRSLLSRLAQFSFVQESVAFDALRHRSMFNAMDNASNWKADLIFRKDRPFAVSEFSRRRPRTIDGRAIPTVTPEDCILIKLEWSVRGDSERQFRDALGIARIQRDRLDWDYLRRWAAELGISSSLDQLALAIQ